jgi:cytochrome c553
VSVAAALALVATAVVPAPEGTAVDAALAAPCLGCHDDRHNTLGGRDEGELFRALQAWRANADSGELMSRIARGYTIEELRAIAGYLAAQ